MSEVEHWEGALNSTADGLASAAHRDRRDALPPTAGPNPDESPVPRWHELGRGEASAVAKGLETERQTSRRRAHRAEPGRVARRLHRTQAERSSTQFWVRPGIAKRPRARRIGVGIPIWMFVLAIGFGCAIALAHVDL
jgi:hypothetical protein